ncbi:hypothetical protein DFH28DRAFT_1077271 [Melampsora americana]|nr:hypothetical protein DFH28DRAFT_1077271 [Melampsora americana]
MDLFTKKSCQTMAFMSHWPILLIAMGVRDLPHLTPTTPATYAEPWFHLAEPRDLSPIQHHGYLFEDKFTTTAGQEDLDVFNTRDGLIDNRWGGDESREQHSIFKEVGEETQTHPFLSISQIAPWRDTHLSNLPPSDAHTEMPGEWSRLEDLYESGEWNALKARKTSPELEHDHHRDLFQDDVFEELPNIVSIPALKEYHSYLSSSVHTSPSAEHHHAITPIGSPVGDTALHEDRSSMPLLESFLPPSFSVHSPDGILHNEDFQPDNLHESISGLRSGSRSDSKAPKVMEALSHYGHDPNPVAFSNTPLTEFSHSSSDDRILDEYLIRSPESHSLNFLESPMHHEERGPSSPEASSQLRSSLVSSPVSNEFESFEKSFDHLTHGTSETQQGPESSGEFSRGSSIPLDSLLHELDSPPHLDDLHVDDLHLDDLPNFGELFTEPHMHISAVSGQHGLSSERSPSTSFKSDARTNSKAASDIEKSDGTASSKLVKWGRDKVEMDRDNSDMNYGENLRQDKHITNSQNTKLPSQDALVSSSRSGQLKRPSQTYQTDSEPLKQKSRLDPFSFDEHERSISQAKQLSTSTATETHIMTSSTRPSLHSSWLQSKPHADLKFDSETNSGFEEPDNDQTLSRNFHQTHSKDMVIARVHSRTLADQKFKEAVSAYPTGISELHNVLRWTNKSPHKTVNLNLANQRSLSYRDLIDTFQPEITEFMNSIYRNEPRLWQSRHLIGNMRMLWDNYLEMIASCSTLMSSKPIFLMRISWISEQWKRIPETKFNWWPVRGAIYSTGKPHEGFGFVKGFSEATSRSIHDGTVFWLNHRLYQQRREHVAIAFVSRFLHEKRKHWVEFLTPKRSDHGLVTRTLLNKVKSVNPLRYPATSKLPRVRDIRLENPMGL